MSTTRRPAARSVSHIGGARETVRDILRDIARRRFAEIFGVALVVLAAVMAIALMSWSVRDPSFNHAGDAKEALALRQSPARI